VMCLGEAPSPPPPRQSIAAGGASLSGDTRCEGNAEALSDVLCSG